jgi:hypothetical protein
MGLRKADLGHRGSRRGLLTFALAVIAVTLAACSRAEPTDTVEQAIPPSGREAYPTPVQEAFTQACQTFGADKASCECALKQVGATIPASHFHEYEELLENGAPSARILALLGHIIAHCEIAQRGPQLERETRELEREVREGSKAAE